MASPNENDKAQTDKIAKKTEVDLQKYTAAMRTESW